MKPFLASCAFLLILLAIVPTADARRGSCANGACAAPAKAEQPRAPKGGIVIDGKTYKPGQFIPTDKAAVSAPVEFADHRQPVRAVGKAVGKRLLAPVRAIRRGVCRGGRCGG